jgi:hypothetical protein
MLHVETERDQVPLPYFPTPPAKPGFQFAQGDEIETHAPEAQLQIDFVAGVEVAHGGPSIAIHGTVPVVGH